MTAIHAAPANISRRAAAARVRRLEVGVAAGWLSKDTALSFLPRCTGFSIDFWRPGVV